MYARARTHTHTHIIYICNIYITYKLSHRLFAGLSFKYNVMYTYTMYLTYKLHHRQFVGLSVRVKRPCVT